MIYILILAALSMEIIGSYISIVGLSSVFAKDPIILAMVVSLDVAKIVTVSFVYRNWRDLNIPMRTYMASAVIVLMALTSTGLFGYLSSAFMSTITPVVSHQEKAARLEGKLVTAKGDRDRQLERQRQIDSQIANLPTESIKGRARLMATFKEDRDAIASKLTKLDADIENTERQLDVIKNTDTSVKTHVGPILYISKITGLPLEQTVTWLIVVIIAVFEPLAVLMVIAANYLIAKRERVAVVVENAKTVSPVETVPSNNETIADPTTGGVIDQNVVVINNPPEPDDVHESDTVVQSALQVDLTPHQDSTEVAPVGPVPPIDPTIPKKRQRRPRKKKEIPAALEISNSEPIADGHVPSIVVVEGTSIDAVDAVEKSLKPDEVELATEVPPVRDMDYQASLLDDIKAHEIRRLYPKKHQHSVSPTVAITDVYQTDPVPPTL